MKSGKKSTIARKGQKRFNIIKEYIKKKKKKNSRQITLTNLIRYYVNINKHVLTIHAKF